MSKAYRFDGNIYGLDKVLGSTEAPGGKPMDSVTHFIWQVSAPDTLDAVEAAVYFYFYEPGLWYCEAHTGQRDCPHILAVQASLCPNCGEPLGVDPSIDFPWCATCQKQYEDHRIRIPLQGG